jgi:hypothetical protein
MSKFEYIESLLEVIEKLTRIIKIQSEILEMYGIEWTKEN